MKNTCILLLILFSVVSLKAQKFEHIKGDGYVAIKSEHLDSLLKSYKAIGPMTMYSVKNIDGNKKWLHAVKNDALRGILRNKVEGVKGGLLCMMYFDKQGKVIDITFTISNPIYEKLDESDIRYIYNQLMKQAINMNYLVWDEVFNYNFYNFDLLRK